MCVYVYDVFYILLLFLSSINIHTLKAKSKLKNDITIQVSDPNTFLSPALGFSIKSQLGKPSTLLNASGATSYTWNTGVTTTSVTDTPTVTTTYTVNGNDVNGCNGTAMATVNVNDCVGLQNLSTNTLNVNLYPNPNNGLFTIETRSTENKNIIVTDVTGRIVLAKSTSENSFAADLKDLNNGLYFVSIKTTSSTVSIKIVKN